MSAKELTQHLESNIFSLTQKQGLRLLGISIGIIYTWFGTLKFFPGLSPAEVLAGDTLSVLTLGLIPHWILLWGLAIWEVLIGLGLILGIRAKAICWLLLLHMVGTLTPFLLFPELTFTQFPLQFSLLGQYIMKNLVIISAALIIYPKNKSQH